MPMRAFPLFALLALACSNTKPGDTAGAAEADTSAVADSAEPRCDNGCSDGDCDCFSASEDDCDDGDPDIHPDAEEVCDGVDNNCDGRVDEGLTTTVYVDADGDGWGDASASSEACEPSDGWVKNDDDCDDTRAEVKPGATEVCNAVDDDCDGEVDDGAAAGTWYEDHDGDGAGDPSLAVHACTQPADTVADATDCNDADASVTACRSCQELLDLGVGTTDGVYTLDPCGGAPSDFWCDQTTDGGGWTAAGWQAASAVTTLGLSVRNSPGDPDFSVDLACLGFDEIAVFNQTYGLSEGQSYPGQVWSETAINLHIGDPGLAFAQGTYGPSDSLMVMACVDYQYSGSVVTEYACDSDGQWGPRGHMTDYAGEYCGARLDYTWAWVDGATCAYTGTAYTWGFMLRGYGGGGGAED